MGVVAVDVRGLRYGCRRVAVVDVVVVAEISM
jgi:hypothetical protein